MAAINVKQAKALIRKEIKKKILSTYDTQKLQHESQWVADFIRKLPQYKSAKSLTCFVSIDKIEIDTDLLLRYCFQDQKKVYLPRVMDDDINNRMNMFHTFSFDEIYDDKRFTKSKWGIYEPKPTYNDNTDAKQLLFRDNAMDTLDLDLMIIPGVAFNDNNHRLGHGKGFYDRFFTKYKSLLKDKSAFPYLIGIGLSANHSEEIPNEDHDWVLDQIVQLRDSDHASS